MITYLRLRAPNDKNGNPRRIFLIYRIESNQADLIATVDEEYRGNGEVLKRWPNAISMGDLSTTISEYCTLLKFPNKE